MVEAPVWQGTAYKGYDFAALAELADQVVVRITPYDSEAADFPVAPMEPLEEVYYALAELRDTAESGHLSLLMTTTGTAWSNGRLTGSIAAPEIEACSPIPRPGATTPTATPAPISPPMTRIRRSGIWTAKPPGSGSGWPPSSAWTSCA